MLKLFAELNPIALQKTLKVVPLPSTDVTVILPPICSTIDLQIPSPKPLPAGF